MISFPVILIVLIIHLFGDFSLQTHDQAVNKSKSNKWLTYHVVSYSLIWFISSYLLFNRWDLAFLFGIITFASHWITDYITSRINKSFYEKEDMHNFYLTIGIDQVFHYLQLFLTYMYLKQLL